PGFTRRRRAADVPPRGRGYAHARAERDRRARQGPRRGGAAASPGRPGSGGSRAALLAWQPREPRVAWQPREPRVARQPRQPWLAWQPRVARQLVAGASDVEAR